MWRQIGRDSWHGLMARQLHLITSAGRTARDSTADSLNHLIGTAISRTRNRLGFYAPYEELRVSFKPI